jgi:hypothetical protein
MTKLCKALSRLYGTSVFYRKYKPLLRYDDFLAMFVQQQLRREGRGNPK